MIAKRLTLLIVNVFFAAMTSFAHDFEVDGIYYNNNSDGTSVSVTYEGSSYDSYSNEYSGDVVIPSEVTYDGNTYSVTSIGNSAFRWCTALDSVTIPNSVNSIGNYAFNYCKGLTSITIPNSVTSIDDDAFRGTPFYNNMQNGVIYLGSVLYKYKGTMPDNSKIDIKDGTISISPNAFSNCSGLTSITIPNSVTTIGDEAFYYCSGLTSITIPNSVTSIGGWAFSYCSGLTSVAIGNSVTSIGNSAFRDCSGLTSVIYNAENCNSLSSNLLSGSPISSFTIGENVKTIPAYLCYGLSQLTSITIPNSVTTIGDHAFCVCTGLTSVTIGNSVNSIGRSAFYWCKGLTSVTIPNSVISIGDYAFSDCDGLTSITIPNSVNSIGDSAFWCCYGLRSVIVGNGINYIDGSAFDGCTNLQKSAYPEVIPNPFEDGIGISYPVDAYMDKDGVIYDYTKSKVYFAPINLKEYTIPTSVSSIGSYAFGWCSDMQSVDISSSVNYIGFRGFYQCSTLSSIQCDAATPPSLSTSVFDGVDKQNCSLIVPDGSLEAYKAADQWKDFLHIGGVEEIAIEESNISIENGKIINSNNENIEVYNLSGIKVYSGNKAEVELNSGVYIVVICNKAVKIAL